MRITFVLPVVNLSGGIRVLALHAEHLQRRGHQVTAVSVQLPQPSFKDIARSVLRGRGWPKVDVNAPSHFDGLPLEHRRLPHAGPVTEADVPDADVVIGTWWSTVKWMNQFSPRKGAKVHFVQGYDVYGGPPEEVNGTYALPIPKIVISVWLRDLIQSKFGQTPIAVVGNSVSTDEFYAPARGKQAKPTVGTIYATDHNKGTDIILKAYDLALARLPDLQLRCMGTATVIPELPLPKGVDYHFGVRDQKLRDVYASCDAWLFGSRQEGFGLPILEAMACRTPVIAAPGGAAPELLSKNGGILVPREDPQAMADAIVKICSLPDAEWRALSDVALGTATSYTWSDASALFEKALEKVVEQARGQ